MKQLSAKMREFGKLVASGVAPVDAYQQAYGCSRLTAGQNAKRRLRSAPMKQYLDELLAQDRQDVLPLREEVRAFLTQTMRDEAMEMTARLKAAKQLSELEGFDAQPTEVKTDISFRAAIVAGAAESMVRE